MDLGTLRGYEYGADARLGRFGLRAGGLLGVLPLGPRPQVRGRFGPGLTSLCFVHDDHLQCPPLVLVVVCLWACRQR